MIAFRVGSSLYDPDVSKDEARIILALRRAMPEWEPWQVSQFARNYRDVRRGEWPGPRPPWDAASMEAFIALAHRDRIQPGTLQTAIDAGHVPAFGWASVSDRAAPEETSTRKRKGGTGHGRQKSTR
ncbi:MAG: hypothetical protein M3T56_02065 [Chloroflexota bacterium]|nr:hypothetical protein [Chloroflexota bacterium]